MRLHRLAIATLLATIGVPGAALAGVSVTTTTTLDHSPALVYQGDSYTLTATVEPNPGEGTVNFVYFVPFEGWVWVPVDLDPDGTASHTLTARNDGNGGQHTEAYFGGAPGFEPSMDVHFVPVASPPSVSIPHPPGPTQSGSVSIAFVTSPGMTTECRLDGSAWDDCVSPFSASGLEEGSHTFEVRATDGNGRTGPAKPATWMVDQTGPVPGTLQFDDGLTSTNRELHTLHYPATDALTDIQRVRVSRTGVLGDDGNLWLDPDFTQSFDRLWESGGPSTPLYLDMFTVPSGEQTFWVQWFDLAGNGSSIESLSIDVRAAQAHVGSDWTTQTGIVPLSISGIDPDEIHGVLISNYKDIQDGQLAYAAFYEEPPATWDATDPAYGGTSGDGLRVVSVQWLDQYGSWSDVMDAAIQVLAEPVPDVVIEEGATTSLDPAVWVVASAGSQPVYHPPIELTLGYSCDGTNWSQQSSMFSTIAISLVDPHGGCTETDGLREMHFRWRAGWGPWASWSSTRTASIDLQWDHSIPVDDWFAPIGSVEIADGADAVTGASVSLDVGAADAGSGVTEVRLSNDGQTWTKRPYAPTQAWTLAGGSGTKTVWASWRDAANNWSDPVSDTVIVDSAKPTVSTPKVAFDVGARMRSGGAVPVTLSWTGADSGSGVARYEAAVSVDGGAFATVASNLTSPSFDRKLSPDHSYRFRVRAIDGAGNRGTWQESAVVRRSVVGDGSALIDYDGLWDVATGDGFLGGTERQSRDAGATAKVSIFGRAVAWVASVGPGRGRAKVFVDGDLVATIDLEANSTVTRRVVWAQRWSTVGSHTIRVKVLGTAGRPRVDLDAIAILR